jgi:glucose-6-phosphate-specific signal transduction histidine kinase
MYGYLWVVGSASVIFAAVISYAMTRRYGWGAALLLPLLAVATMIAMQWQAQGLGLEDGLRLAGASLVFSAPLLLGVLAGIAIARLRRG